MIETVEIKAFLKTGNFGEFKEIYFGMMRDSLIEVLGNSEWQHFTSKKSKIPSIYGYGNVEFYFEEGIDGRLNGIQILPKSKIEQVETLKINYDFIAPTLKYKTAIKYLNKNSIKYQKVPSKFDSDDIFRIETEGGVQLIFLKNFDESISIHQVSNSVSLTSGQEKQKQISFSIPESEYQKLRDLANQERKSAVF